MNVLASNYFDSSQLLWDCRYQASAMSGGVINNRVTSYPGSAFPNLTVVDGGTPQFETNSGLEMLKMQRSADALVGRSPRGISHTEIVVLWSPPSNPAGSGNVFMFFGKGMTIPGDLTGDLDLAADLDDNDSPQWSTLAFWNSGGSLRPRVSPIDNNGGFNAVSGSPAPNVTGLSPGNIHIACIIRTPDTVKASLDLGRTYVSDTSTIAGTGVVADRWWAIGHHDTAARVWDTANSPGIVQNTVVAGDQDSIDQAGLQSYLDALNIAAMGGTLNDFSSDFSNDFGG